MPASSPAVLLTSTCWWPSVSRLALALVEAGCDVSVVSPARGHPVAAVAAVRQVASYSAAEPLRALINGISAAQPDIIVPCDERAVSHLHQLRAMQGTPDPIVGLIERSLGDPAAYAVTRARAPLLAVAKAAGIATPEMAPLRSPEDLDQWLARHGLPCVLKVDGSSGGRGVCMAHTREEAHQAFHQLVRPCAFSVAMKRSVVNRNFYWLGDAWRRIPGVVSVQAYVHGQPANCAVFCWQGRVLAGIAVEVLQTKQLASPATVVKVTDQPEMLRAAELLGGRLMMSGFFGLDFIIDTQTGMPQLIEMNARPTPLCHLRLGAGRDLVGALSSTLSGQPLVALEVTQAAVIGYFPEALRVGAAELPPDAYHDVPLTEPALMQELLRRPWPDRSILARACRWTTKLTAPGGKLAPRRTGTRPAFVETLKQPRTASAKAEAS